LGDALRITGTSLVVWALALAVFTDLEHRVADRVREVAGGSPVSGSK
jgi:hypothetical protein